MHRMEGGVVQIGEGLSRNESEQCRTVVKRAAV